MCGKTTLVTVCYSIRSCFAGVMLVLLMLLNMFLRYNIDLNLNYCELVEPSSMKERKKDNAWVDFGEKNCQKHFQKHVAFFQAA